MNILEYLEKKYNQVCFLPIITFIVYFIPLICWRDITLFLKPLSLINEEGIF